MPRQTTPPAGQAGQTADGAPARAPAAEITTFQTAIRFLNDRVDVERTRPSRIARTVFKLDRMRALMHALGDPQRDVRCVHIAGSKGKGSVAEMVSSCLEACGYTVGLYTSPHLVDVRERVRINHRLIGYADFAHLMRRIAEAAHPLEREHGAPTYFELMTALAIVHFAEQAVDLGVIEVGLGGRLDATNVVEPEATAVAAIQLEHTDLLGSTLAEIAREKAGIFKAGVPALTIPQDEQAMEALRAEAQRVGAPLLVVGKDIEFSYRFEADPELGPHARVCLTTERSNYEHLAVPLKGEHQAYNCGLALAVLDRLRERGYDAPERQVALGLAATPDDGRMEMVLDRPRIILDGAHNPDSVGALVRAIGAHIRYDSMVVVFGCAADKDIDGMLREVGRGADKIIFTRSSHNPRAMDPHELHRRFAELSHKMAQVEANLKEAINTAARAVGRDDLICVTGSFYLVGEAKKMLEDLKAKRAAGGK